MCPYFWTYVLIFLFIVPILIVKMFGRAGTTFLSWVKDYKYNKERRIVASLEARCSNPNLTEAEAHAIYKSKCYKKYQWDIDYQIKNKIYEMYIREDDRIHVIKRQEAHEAYAKAEARKEKFQSTVTKFETYRENKVVNFITYLFAGSLLLFIVGVMLYGIYSVGVMVPWATVGTGLLVGLTALAIVATAVFIIYSLIVYVFKPFFKWVACVKMPNCSLCSGIKRFFGKVVYLKYLLYIFLPLWWVVLGIGKLFAIIGHMVYSTYKKRCPIIEWKE
jgi:hypothetical protein